MTAWRSKAELGFFAGPLLEQFSFRIRRGLMGLIAAVLARKITPAVAVLGALVPFVLGPEAFQGGPGFD
jgi:hypothetical protein